MIRGRVIAAADASVPDLPLRRARLTVIAGGRASQPVFADEMGLFEASVPAAPYVIRVTKSGYAPLDVPRPAGPEQPLTIHMRVAAVLRGRVVDGAGDPAVGAPVRIRRLSPQSAAAPTEAVVDTDD